MIALVDPKEQERELDELYTAEMRWQLDQRMRAALVEWGRKQSNTFLFYAVESASRGYWDDVRGDLRKGKITLGQANQIADKCVEYRLIMQRQADYYKQQFEWVVKNEQ